MPRFFLGPFINAAILLFSLAACQSDGDGENINQTGYGRSDRQTNKTVWIVDTGIDLEHPDLNTAPKWMRMHMAFGLLRPTKMENMLPCTHTSIAAPHVAGLLLIRGRNLPTRGYVKGDPRHSMPDPIADEAVSH